MGSTFSMLGKSFDLLEKTKENDNKENNLIIAKCLLTKCKNHQGKEVVR